MVLVVDSERIPDILRNFLGTSQIFIQVLCVHVRKQILHAKTVLLIPKHTVELVREARPIPLRFNIGVCHQCLHVTRPAGNYPKHPQPPSTLRSDTTRRRDISGPHDQN